MHLTKKQECRIMCSEETIKSRKFLRASIYSLPFEELYAFEMKRAYADWSVKEFFLFRHCFLQYSAVKPKERGSDVLPGDLVHPGEKDFRAVLFAALNYANDEVWYTKHPTETQLIRHSKTCELARMIVDAAIGGMIDSGARNDALYEEWCCALEPAHLLLDYTDSWLEEKIGWRPFADFHKSDKELVSALVQVMRRAMREGEESQTGGREIPGTCFLFADDNYTYVNYPLWNRRFADARTGSFAT